jgi:anti-anti-sigma factor
MTLADLQITLAPNALVARVTGEVDMSNAEEMGATVIGATPNESQGVVLDLAEVDYLDSAGIYVIFGMRSSLQARGQRLILVIPPESPVHDTLRLSGVERPGDIATTVPDALRAIDRPASAQA